MTAQHPMSAELRALADRSVLPDAEKLYAAANAIDAMQARCDALAKSLDTITSDMDAESDGRYVNSDGTEFDIMWDDVSEAHGLVAAERAHREGEGS
ncbi:MAG: hypothetical protein QNJ92_06820 [Alphaproteobacteria bacterium]|nr:hypothetical protein [Alphaproteobacteria bacterium]